MSHFSFENEVNDLLRLDAPISKGPAPRWQRKSTKDARRSSATSTPLKNSSLLNKTKTPSKTPKSIGSKTPKTPSEDRFIPNRASMNFEMNYWKMVSNGNEENEVEETSSPSKTEFRKNVSENLCGNDTKARILSYKNKAPTPREGKFSVTCARVVIFSSTVFHASCARLKVYQEAVK